jgi:hypothetical protein
LFGLKILKFFVADLGFSAFLAQDLGSLMEIFRSGINIPDALHW